MKKMFWVDLEMSGLDESRDAIMEVAVIVTDLDLNAVEEYHQIVFQPPEVLETMHPWCIQHHGASGLTAACASGKALADVEKDLQAIAARHYSPGERIVLCGNSVGTDRRFLARSMPKLAERLHYRVLDVSSFKIVFREKFGIIVDKGDAHRALDDVRASIAELARYLEFIRVEKPQP